MTKLTDIAMGWYLFAAARPEDKALITQRLETCDHCDYKEQLSPTGTVLVQTINKTGSIYKCGHCQCPLAAKTADPKGKCPLGKW